MGNVCLRLPAAVMGLVEGRNVLEDMRDPLEKGQGGIRGHSKLSVAEL